MTKVKVRAALPLDLPHCLAIDPGYTTDHVWQMDSRSQAGQIAVAFRTVRLPREMRVAYPRDARALSAGWQACDAMLVAEDAGGIVGYAALSQRAPQATAWLHDLLGARAVGRTGVCSALLAAAARWGQARSLRWLVLEVQTKNYPAISFCQQHGLTFCGFNDRYFANQDIALFFAQRLRADSVGVG